MPRSNQDAIVLRRLEFSDSKYVSAIEKCLSEIGYSLSNPRQLANAVVQASDFYINNPDKSTPWSQKWMQAAYLVYYFPLNYVRASAVITEGIKRDFFPNVYSWVDFGSAMGVATLAMQDLLKLSQQKDITCVEKEVSLQTVYKAMGGERARFQTPTQYQWQGENLAIFSYVYTELKEMPKWVEKCDNLVIIEPSTQFDGRRLQELRQNLIGKGYEIWAPCLHQRTCPLLVESKRDWCHDRIEFAAPKWFLEIEKFLPIKNQELSFSYLLVSRRKAPLHANQLRVIGDLQHERGKSKQLICRGESREFLTWLHKEGDAPDLMRGGLVSYKSDIEKKSNELRPGVGQLEEKS